MKISCIIPTRDRCHMVLEALASVMEQQYHEAMEIIIVDDGSTDNTGAEISSRFPEVKQLRLNGDGPGAARNAGACAASGDILMFLDSDDFWLPNHIQRLMEVFRRGFPVAYGVTLTRDEVIGGDFLIPENGKGLEGDCFSAMLRWCFLVPSAMALKREIFHETGGFATVSHGEDWMFFLKLAARFPFGFAGPEPITLRRLHQGSLCFLSDRKKLLAIISHVFSVLEKEPRATASQRNRFKMLYNWTAANTAQWSTVQDWYLSLQKEKII